jgi:hypothetical protein
MKWHDYAWSGLLFVCLCGLVYGWVWWFWIGRRQPGHRTGRAVTALVYSTFLPLLLLGLVPRCYVLLGEILVTGLPFVAIGLILALRGDGKLRSLLTVYALMCFLMFAAASPIHPAPGMSGRQAASAQEGCQPGGL